jgi:hypothetical protein
VQPRTNNPEKLVKIGYRRYKAQTNKAKNTTQYVLEHDIQTNTNNVNKTGTLLLTIGGKDGHRFHAEIITVNFIEF